MESENTRDRVSSFGIPMSDEEWAVQRGLLLERIKTGYYGDLRLPVSPNGRIFSIETSKTTES